MRDQVKHHRLTRLGAAEMLAAAAADDLTAAMATNPEPLSPDQLELEKAWQSVRAAIRHIEKAERLICGEQENAA